MCKDMAQPPRTCGAWYPHRQPEASELLKSINTGQQRIEMDALVRTNTPFNMRASADDLRSRATGKHAAPAGCKPGLEAFLV